MAQAHINHIDIEYETFGDPETAPLLLIMGLGGQLIHWDEAFCRELSDRGFYVVRFDNRDAGRSTVLEDLGVPDIQEIMSAQRDGRAISTPYTLEDMADDAVGLMDWLGLAKAHVTGTSMGGMIAQSIAIRHPSRVLTLTSIMADTGDSILLTSQALEVCIPPPATRQVYIGHTLESMRAIAGPRFPLDEQGVQQLAAIAYERGIHPTGHARQLAAIVAGKSRKDSLRSVTAPTLVIHGDADPLIPLAGGTETANSVPGAELHVIRGMGHELPTAVWPEIIKAIARHAQKVPAPSL